MADSLKYLEHLFKMPGGETSSEYDVSSSGDLTLTTHMSPQRPQAGLSEESYINLVYFLVLLHYYFSDLLSHFLRGLDTD